MYAHDDIRTLNARVLRANGVWPSVIVASPPCQDISCANTKGKGVDGERSGLFFEAIRLVSEIRPVWCAFESTPNLRTRGADRVLAALEALGYACWPLVVGAWHVGAPHRRNRVWIVAANTDSHGQHGEPGYAEVGRMVGASAADAVGERSTRITRAGGRQRAEKAPPIFDPGSDTLPELPPAIRAIAEGSAWNGGADGLARSLRVVNGLSTRMARQCTRSYGDAVVPQITEAIGHVMMRLLPTDGTVLDLFSGASLGWSLGMHRAGYKTIAICEIDDWRRSVAMNIFASGQMEGEMT